MLCGCPYAGIATACLDPTWPVQVLEKARWVQARCGPEIFGEKMPNSSTSDPKNTVSIPDAPDAPRSGVIRIFGANKRMNKLYRAIARTARRDLGPLRDQLRQIPPLEARRL